MAALPYMQFFVADYLADTAHLTTEEHGAYMLLLFSYWQTGKPLRNDRLATVARLSNDRWQSVATTLQEFFHADETHWTHFRVEADLEAIQCRTKQASEAGKASARAKALKKQQEANDRSTTVTTDVPTEAQRNGNHIEESRVEESRESKAGAPSALPAADAADTTAADQPEPPLETKTKANGTRLPADWLLPDEWAQWAADDRPEFTTIDIGRCAESFADYWHSATRNATKLDWQATWRNWFRNQRAPVANVHAFPGLSRHVGLTDNFVVDDVREDGTHAF